ncbi:hypothetical protein Ancab_033576 [Ancistrocladus abbreviatus]
MAVREHPKSHFALFVGFIQVALVLMLCCLVIWVCLAPKCPSFTVTSFYIETLTDNLTSSHTFALRNTSIVLDLQVLNPNKKKSILYGETDVSVFKNGGMVGAKILPPFYQGQKSNISCQVLMNVRKQDREGASSGVVDFMLSLETVVRYEILGWKTRQHHLLFEGHVRVGLDGRLLDNKNVKLEHESNKQQQKNGHFHL